MFGFGTSTAATIAMILSAPVLMCVLLYVLVRLEPPIRRPMWLVDAAAEESRGDIHANAESAA
jgi:hypothetical protein